MAGIKASLSQTEDSVASVLRDISAIVDRQHSAEKVVQLINDVFLLKNAQGNHHIRPSASQVSNILKKKKAVRFSVCSSFTKTLASSIFAALTIISGLIAAGHYYFEEREAIGIMTEVFHNSFQWSEVTKDFKTSLGKHLLGRMVASFLQNVRSLSFYLGLPDSKYFHEMIQDHGCLIANPLHYEGTIPESYCHLCKGINSILTPKSKAYPQPVDGEVLTGLRPLIFRKWGHRATLLELHEQIAENIHILERFPSFFSSNVGYVKRIQDFATPHTINRLLGDPRVQLTWTGHRYMTSQIIRKLFQRPKFLSRDIKVQVPQKIFIDGRDAPPYYISLHDVSDPEVTGEFSHVYYAQGSGSRIIVLKFKGCTSCQPLLARMRSQDILVFNGQFWSAYSQPYGTSTSYGVTGSFFSQNAWIML